MLPPSLSNYFLRGSLSPRSGRIWARNYPAAPWTYRAWRNSNLLPLGAHSCAMKEAEGKEEERNRKSRYISWPLFSFSLLRASSTSPLPRHARLSEESRLSLLSLSWFSNNRGLKSGFQLRRLTEAISIFACKRTPDNRCASYISSSFG